MPPHALANPPNPVLRPAIRPRPGFSRRRAVPPKVCIRGRFYQQLTDTFVSEKRRNPNTLFQLRTLVANLGRRRISRLCFTSAAPSNSLCLTLLTTFRFTRLSALRPQVDLESHAYEKARCFLLFYLLRAANKALTACCGIFKDSARASGVGPADHSQRKTLAESAVKTPKIIASAATSPRCADHGSPIQIPWSSETAYERGTIRATA